MYCSHGCFSATRRGVPLSDNPGRHLTCFQCGKEFFRPGKRLRFARTFCSTECMHSGYRAGGNPNWNGGRRLTLAGYVLAYAPKHPRAHPRLATVPEHILICESALGRHLKGKEEVHHFNEIRSDNRHGNLVICQDHGYHELLHCRRDRKLALGSPNLKRCTFCRGIFSLDGFNRDPRRVDGHGKYCKRCAKSEAAEWRARNMRKTNCANCGGEILRLFNYERPLGAACSSRCGSLLRWSQNV